jgi:hypothetical protein
MSHESDRYDPVEGLRKALAPVKDVPIEDVRAAALEEARRETFADLPWEPDDPD